MKALAPVLALAALAACATGFTPDECRAADWRRLGERDGRDYGLQPQIERYARQCARHGVPVARDSYLDGWREGYGEFQRRTSMGQPGS